MTAIRPLPYRDPAEPLERRVADLLGRMTRAEKVAQLGSFWAFEIVRADGLDPARLAELAGDGIGQVTRLAGSTNLRPIEVGSSRVDLQACKLEYSIVSPK